MGKVIGYIFSDEAQSIIDELIYMRGSLLPGEWFNESARERYEELSKRLNSLMGRADIFEDTPLLIK